MQLDASQWSTVYNILSFGLVSMLATTVYTLVSQNRVLPKYRNALVLSSMVTFIAAYHYLRIFDSFKDATKEGTFEVVTDYNVSSMAFNEGYRYVDWILTVPLP